MCAQETCEPIGEFHPIDAGVVPLDAEADEYTRAPQARVHFGVDGKGLAAVVIDSGINYHHRALKNRVIMQNGKPVGHDLTASGLLDTFGHGSGVAGLIAAEPVLESGITAGIAPGARIIPIKVYRGQADSTVRVTSINKALQWVLDNHRKITTNHQVRIGVVNISLGFSQNGPDALVLLGPERSECKDLIQSLREEEIVVVVASGNLFHDFNSAQGMDFPAICDPAVSVGAVFDVTLDFSPNGLFYKNECRVFRASKDRIAPFSQRLSSKKNPEINTTIFAPGHNVSSVCKWDDAAQDFSKHGASANNGTSRAAPIVAGSVLLVQQMYEVSMETPGLPKVTIVEKSLQEGGKTISDTEEEPAGTFDNVKSTGHDFRRLDVYGALEAVQRLAHDEKTRLNIVAEANRTPNLDAPSIE